MTSIEKGSKNGRVASLDIVPIHLTVSQYLEYRISSVIRQSFFFFQNNTKDLDPSCKTDLDHLGLFRKGKIGIIANFHRTDLVI